MRLEHPITTLLIKHSLRVNGPHLQSQVKRSSGAVSKQKHAYGAPDKRTHRVYDKEHAASQIYRMNLQLGDGCIGFSTSTSEHFPVRDPEHVTIARPNMFASSIPRGDEDPERNKASASATTTKLSYPETDRWNLAPKPDLPLQKHRSNICLGDEHSGSCFFSITQQSHLSATPPEPEGDGRQQETP